MYEKITKLTTLALTLLLATNLCAMEDGMEELTPSKRKAEEPVSSYRPIYRPIKKITLTLSDERAAHQLVALTENGALFALIEPQYTDCETQTTSFTDETAPQTNPFPGREVLLYFLNKEANRENPTLHQALENQDDALFKDLIEIGVNVNQKGIEGRTALHIAAEYGMTDAARILLAHKADPNAKDNSNSNPLHAATERGGFERNVPIIKLLIENGTDVKAEKSNGITPFAQLAPGSGSSCMKELINAGANVNDIDWHGNTTLHLAAEEEDVDLVKFLLDNDADIDAKDPKGYTPLHCAAYGLGGLDITTLLLDRGAKINIQNKNKETPLHIAYRHGHFELAKLLEDRGADQTIKNKEGKTPLDYKK